MVPCANSTLRSCLPSFDDATSCDSVSVRTSGAGRSGFALRGRGERVFSGFSFGPALMRISVAPWAGQSAAPEGAGRDARHDQYGPHSCARMAIFCEEGIEEGIQAVPT